MLQQMLIRCYLQLAGRVWLCRFWEIRASVALKLQCWGVYFWMLESGPRAKCRDESCVPTTCRISTATWSHLYRKVRKFPLFEKHSQFGRRHHFYEPHLETWHFCRAHISKNCSQHGSWKITSGTTSSSRPRKVTSQVVHKFHSLFVLRGKESHLQTRK